MSRTATFFLLVAAPALAIYLALLGISTLPSNPLGWFLLLSGIVFTVGLVIVACIRRERFWESRLSGATAHEEHGDRSFWLITLGMMAEFYLPPLEYLYLTPYLPRTDWIESSGVGLVVSGSALFIWARRTLGVNYAGHVSVKQG